MGLIIGMPISSFLPTQGGAEVGLHNIAIRLLAHGHTPVVITSYTHHRRLQKEHWQLPYRVVSFPPKIWTLFKCYPRAGFFILDYLFLWLKYRYSIDVWHCTMGYPVGVTLIHAATRFGNMPHLVRCAGEDIQCMPEIGYGSRLDLAVDAIVRQWLPKADILIAISESVALEYEQLHVSQERVSFVPNGVDLQRFEQHVDVKTIRSQYNLPKSDFVFIAVGRNHPKKNFTSLIYAGRILKDKGVKGFTILLVGSGVSELHDLAIELDMKKHVCLLEGLSAADNNNRQLALPPQALVDLYNMADCFVFPSLIETFGIVLVEAMAAGLPVITTDAPGCRDIIRRGRDGLLVKPDDTQSMAEAMYKVLTDLECRERLKQKSQTRAQDFSWDVVVERYIVIYAQLLSDNDRQIVSVNP